MNITVIGAGYVGLVTGACFAELGNHVTCVDIDEKKITLLNQGILPIYEPSLDAMIISCMASKRLHFVTSLAEQHVEPHVIFIAVGTPGDQDGSADMRYVLNAAKDIGQFITSHCVIVDKSTVPVGVAGQVAGVINKELALRGIQVEFDVVSNPEFLREGAAINDFMQPDRIIVGIDSLRARAIMLELYTPILRHPEKIYFMTVRDAEMTKYVANAMLATRISFMNEVALLCEKMGVDVENVRLGIGSDSRIGSAFIYPGCGYGGSCFPKDVKALIHMAEQHGVDPVLLQAVEERNTKQKQILPNKIMKRFGRDLSDKRIVVWGLSFKPGTDDMREASSLVLIRNLIEHGATVFAHDPVAMSAARAQLPAEWVAADRLVFMDTPYAMPATVDALVLVTEWKLFSYPDWELLKKKMRQRVVFDGRNQYDPLQVIDAGFEYYGIGRGEDIAMMATTSSY